jgi:hypothetical protein
VSVRLVELLALVGRLDDAPGIDTPRERFRRFLTEHVTTIDILRDLLHQSQERLGAQHARARQDLALSIGRFLGLDVTFGSYDHRRGPARLAGHWRWRHTAHLAVDVCSEQSVDADLDTFARTVATLDAATAPDSDEHWVGLCLTTRFFAARERLAERARHCQPPIYVSTAESLLWLAEMHAAGRLSTEVIVRLIVGEVDCDFLVDVMRGFGESPAGERPLGAAALSSAPVALEPLTEFVWPTPDVDRPTGFWLARIDGEPTTPPDEIFEAIVVRRKLLAIAAGDPAGSMVRSSDRVCFLGTGIGVLGSAQVGTAVDDPSHVLRAGRSYAAVFDLHDVSIFEPPRRLPDGAVAARVETAASDDVAGVSLVPVTRVEFASVTGRVELVIGGGKDEDEDLRVRA